MEDGAAALPGWTVFARTHAGISEVMEDSGVPVRHPPFACALFAALVMAIDASFMHPLSEGSQAYACATAAAALCPFPH